MNMSHSTRMQMYWLNVRIDTLQNQIDELVRRIGGQPMPERERWERYSMPEMRDVEELPTKVVPIVRKERPIYRVTISLGGEQMVTSYDVHGKRIEAYCGPFRLIGTEVLSLAGNKPWSIIKSA